MHLNNTFNTTEIYQFLSFMPCYIYNYYVLSWNISKTLQMLARASMFDWYGYLRNKLENNIGKRSLSCLIGEWLNKCPQYPLSHVKRRGANKYLCMPKVNRHLRCKIKTLNNSIILIYAATCGYAFRKFLKIGSSMLNVKYTL